jgi:hypothetical protein
MVSIAELQRLAGIRVEGYGNSLRKTAEGSNISVTAAEKAQIQRERDIQPGTPEWFQLWFSLPYLTGEKPWGKRKPVNKA